ncbi:MAG: carboxylesterase family protein [Pseudobutyrivibrio sp.]|nr:carboxylesterase family protein [Pseudobutyrivibrio sp.]
MSIIETKLGKIEGIDKNGYTLFAGVPFAKPPVGEFRWKAPVAVEPWEGVKKATEFAPICPQDEAAPPNPYFREFYDYEGYKREQSEDCLYLNIWMPENAAGKKLPVALFIHGGAFAGGYSSEIEFDGEAVCKKDVIYVSIAYRLGVFGFLALPQLDAENDRGISGNYGILDQIMALNWVYDNIESFGGDKDNITVFGQSAGCMSTQILISSDLTKGKIAKAFLMSGITCDDKFLATPTLKEEEQYCKEMLGKYADYTAEQLREIDVERLLNKFRMYNMIQMENSMTEGGNEGGFLIVPNVDGYVLKKSVRDVYRDGEFHKIPYIVGCVTDDLGTTPKDKNEHTPGLLFDQAKKWAIRQLEVGNTDAFVYWFDRTLPGDNAPTWHSLDLWYVMGTYNKSWRPMTTDDAAISDEILSAWTNFCKTGNPEGPGESEWKPYTKENQFVKIFGRL